MLESKGPLGNLVCASPGERKRILLLEHGLEWLRYDKGGNSVVRTLIGGIGYQSIDGMKRLITCKGE